MDDRELETRLRTHLHLRLDPAQPSPELLAGVDQVFATGRRIVAVSAYRPRPVSVSWPVVTAAAVVLAAALAAGRIGGLLIPANPNPTPSPSATVATPVERQFIVLPPTAAVPPKGDTTIAEWVLRTRLTTLGVEATNAWGADGAMTFTVPSAGASDDSVRAVLASTGDVAFVPLPLADYGDGPYTAEVGEPLPKDESALFGWDGIGAVTDDKSAPDRRLLIHLEPAAAKAFGTYSAAHVLESFAVVIDGRVALIPLVRVPITDGVIALEFDVTDDQGRWAFAVLGTGRLPASWARPVVPTIIPADRVVDATLRELPAGASALSTDLSAIQVEAGFPWVAVWRITFGGTFMKDCPTPPSQPSDPCPAFSRLVVTADASTGEAISSDYAP